MLWKASFIVGNYVFENPLSINYDPPFTSEINFELTPTDKGTTLSIIFDTEVSKPPVLQRRKALMLLSMFKEISAPFVMGDFDTELTELTPVSQKDKEKYNNIESPSDWSFTLKPKIIKNDTAKKIEETFHKVHSRKYIFSGEDISQYQNITLLRTMLKWYNKSLESKGLLDKFVSLWVTFNVIYDYIWVHNHPNKKFPNHSTRISDCICLTLNKDECKQIFEPHKLFVSHQMPLYELIGTKEEGETAELFRSKDVKKIEENHKKFLMITKDWRLNKNDSWLENNGLNFGKYWYIEDWVNSLVQVLLNIYQVRNSIFHSGAIPNERVEGIIDNPEEFQYWSMRNDILSHVDAFLISKILNHF